MSFKHLICAAALASFTLPAAAEFNSPWRIDDSKYESGDCITATDQSLSFYGHYARVKGVVSFSGQADPGVYVLWFPVFVPRTPLHSRLIEDKTQQVEDHFCERQQAQ